MNFKRNQIFLILTFVLGWSSLLPSLLQAKPIGLFGNWKAYFQGQDDDDTEDGLVQFRQLYNTSWTPMLTRNMSFDANIGYSNNWVKDLGDREIINPSLQFNVKNDLFSLGMNGDLLKNNISFREDREISSWNANLSSSWTNFLWPELTLRMGQRFEETSGYGVRLEDDSAYSYVGTSVTWQGYRLKLFYDYNRSRLDEDNILGATQQDIEGHLGKLEYGDVFFSNRVSLNFSQLIYDNNTEFSSNGEASLLQVPVVSAHSGVDVSPVVGGLPINQALIDGNRTVPAVSIQLQQPVNLALRTNFNIVDRLYVYTTRDDKLIVANTSAVTWALYTSSDGFSWQLIQNNVPSSFNNTDFRFEIATGAIRAEYIKLVVTGWMPALDIDVTEMEAFRFLTGDTAGNYDRSSRNYKTELYLGVIPLDRTRFNYTFSWDRTENTGTEASEVQQLIQSARLNWDYSQYLAPSIGFNNVNNKNDRPGAIDTETRSYDLQIRSTPLPTVDLSFASSWQEYFENEERERSSNNVSLTAIAALYPDLSSEMTVGYNNSESDITDAKSDSYYITFTLRSILRKSLNLDLQSNYFWSDSDSFIFVDEHLQHGSIASFESTSSEAGDTFLTIG